MVGTPLCHKPLDRTTSSFLRTSSSATTTCTMSSDKCSEASDSVDDFPRLQGKPGKEQRAEQPSGAAWASAAKGTAEPRTDRAGLHGSGGLGLAAARPAALGPSKLRRAMAGAPWRSESAWPAQQWPSAGSFEEFLAATPTQQEGEPLARTFSVLAASAGGAELKIEASGDDDQDAVYYPSSTASCTPLASPRPRLEHQSNARAKIRLNSQATLFTPTAAATLLTPTAAAAHGGSSGPPLAAEPEPKASQSPTAEHSTSPTSWAAQQRARRSGWLVTQQQVDAEVGRAVKSLLNKLTLENFTKLAQQIMAVGMSTTTHVEMMITEVFEKATSQHHYIDMYADLCVLLSEYFALNPVGNDPKFSFKRLLLHECQASFERHLGSPDLKGLDDQEERQLSEFRHKRRMLGNMKLIGALLVRRMLAGKVFLAILAEFVGKPTSEAMECAAALLTVTGAFFDTQDWAHYSRLDGIFVQLQSFVRQPACAPRTRCLVQDVLDLRASGWKGCRPGRAAAPSTLKEVSVQQAVDLGLF